MLAPFIVCLREGIEIFLVIIPLVVYFNKNKLSEMSKSIYKGGALGGLIAAIIGSIIFSQISILGESSSELFDGILGIVLSGLILYGVVLLRKNKTFDVNPDEKMASLSKKGLFLLAAVTVFRELLESVLFILTSSGEGPLLVAGSAMLGLVTSALIVYIVAKGFSNINISVVFYVLNLFLVGLGSYYFADGASVLFGESIPDIFVICLLAYAIPSYFIIIKKDLKKYLESNRIK
ncbi:MAG: FTR1 family protein [Clostridiaceae bacterium]